MDDAISPPTGTAVIDICTSALHPLGIGLSALVWLILLRMVSGLNLDSSPYQKTVHLLVYYPSVL